MKIESDNVTFSTGKVCYAHRGILGLSPHDENDPKGWDVCEGHDGYFSGYCKGGVGGLTTEERLELAEYMIELWARFKARYQGEWWKEYYNNKQGWLSWRERSVSSR